MPNALQGLLADPRGEMRATPRNKLMGLLADALQGAQDYAQRPDPRMPGGKANPVLGLLADAASLQSLATTAQRVSYGEPLTNKGKANVPFLRPETADVAMLAPLSPRNALAALGMVGGVADNGAMKAVYLAHTPLRPNPLVGTRYEREYIGGLADKTPRSIEDLRGSSIVAMPWDSTSRNYRIKSISDEVLPESTLTTGGQDFARDINHINANIGGASNFQIARRIQSRNQVAAQENLAAGGNGDVYMLPTTMGEGGENFSTMPSDVLLQLVNNAKLNKKQLKALNLEIQQAPLATPNGLTRPFSGFVGFNDPNVAQQLLTGDGVDTTAGNLRKAIVDRLTLARNQQLLGFNAPDLSAALLDDSLRGVPKGYAGNTLIKAVGDTALLPSTHPSYNTDFGGKYFGSLMNSIPIESLMPKTYNRLAQEFAGKRGDIRNMTIGAMEKRGAGFSELVDDQTIEAVNRYLDSLKPR